LEIFLSGLTAVEKWGGRSTYLSKRSEKRPLFVVKDPTDFHLLRGPKELAQKWTREMEGKFHPAT